MAVAVALRTVYHSSLVVIYVSVHNYTVVGQYPQCTAEELANTD